MELSSSLKIQSPGHTSQCQGPLEMAEGQNAHFIFLCPSREAE